MFPLSCFVLRFLLKKYRTVFQNQINIWWEPRPRQTPYQNTKKLFSRNSLFLYFFVLLIIYQIFLKKSNKVAFVLALWPFLLEYSSACFAPRAFVLVPPPLLSSLQQHFSRQWERRTCTSATKKRGLLSLSLYPMILAPFPYSNLKTLV